MIGGIDSIIIKDDNGLKPAAGAEVFFLGKSPKGQSFPESGAVQFAFVVSERDADNGKLYIRLPGKNWVTV